MDEISLLRTALEEANGRLSAMQRELGDLRSRTRELAESSSYESALSKARSEVAATNSDSSRSSQPDELHVSPIGFVESGFVQKNGTPRQAGLVPAAPAKLRINWGSNPEHTLQGLEGFSHVWLLWVFDKNAGGAVKAKVRPPRGGGLTTGVFACRTPHRPNPIGLSLVTLRSVMDDTIYFDGGDLCDGTPVIDIKPYIPFADTPSSEDVRVPNWVVKGNAEQTDVPASARDSEAGDCHVVFTPEARESLRLICCAPDWAIESHARRSNSRPPALRFFRNDPARAEQAFRQALAADPRSIYRKHKCADQTYYIDIDGIDAVCSFDGNTVKVQQIRLMSDCDAR